MTNTIKHVEWSEIYRHASEQRKARVDWDWDGGHLAFEGDLHHWLEGDGLSVLFGAADIPIGSSGMPGVRLESLEVDVPTESRTITRDDGDDALVAALRTVQSGQRITVELRDGQDSAVLTGPLRDAGTMRGIVAFPLGWATVQTSNGSLSSALHSITIPGTPVTYCWARESGERWPL